MGMTGMPSSSMDPRLGGSFLEEDPLRREVPSSMRRTDEGGGEGESAPLGGSLGPPPQLSRLNRPITERLDGSIPPVVVEGRGVV
jgi:hypothetical protein